MGRQQRSSTTLTLGDFVVKRGLRTRQRRLKWKKRDNQRNGSRRLVKRGKGYKKKKRYRALEQLMVARDIEEYDRKQEEREKAARASKKEQLDKNATAAPSSNRVMVDVVNTINAPQAAQSVEKLTAPPPPQVDEGAFRARVLDSVLCTLFVPKQAVAAPGAVEAGGEGCEAAGEAPVVLDELDQMSMRRIVEAALFWKVKQQPSFRYSQLYWFVPDERAAECFVTPRVITRIFEELMKADEPLERGLRVMLLKAIHSTLPAMRHTVLRSLHEWASALHQQQQSPLKGPAPFRSDERAGGGGTGHGLVQLWADLVRRCSAWAAVEDQQTDAAAAAAVPSFAEPAMLLSRAFGSFLKNPQLLVHHGEVLIEAAAQLVQWRPMRIGSSMLSLLLAKWPRRSSGQELCCVRLLGALLGATSPEHLALKEGRLLTELARRMPLLVQSPHEKVAMEAMDMLTNMYIFLRYVVAFPVLATEVSKGLFVARSHWSTRVKDKAEKIFDQMLDYA